TRPIQPRLPVALDPDLAPEQREAAIAAAGRRLARLGLRVDHRRVGDIDGPALDPNQVPDRIDGLLPLLDALGLDPATACPFDPDGQDPPPVEREPPGWAPPCDEAGSRR